MTLEGSLPYSVHNLVYWAVTETIHNHCSNAVYYYAPNCVNSVREYVRDSVNQLISFPLRNHAYNAATDIINSYEDL